MDDVKNAIPKLQKAIECLEFEIYFAVNKMLTDFSKKTGVVVGIEMKTGAHPYSTEIGIIAPQQIHSWYGVEVKIIPLLTGTAKHGCDFQEEMRVGYVAEKEGKVYDCDEEAWV